MKGALIILAVTVLIGVILYLLDRRSSRKQPEGAEDPSGTNNPEDSDKSYKSYNSDKSYNADGGDQGEPAGSAQLSGSAEPAEEGSGECCGLHLVCEKELTAIEKGEILYYDDEELDRFADMDPEDYTAADVEEFRDVLMTLLPQDTAGWARSLDARHIRPPQEIRDELIILLRELAG